MKSSSQEPSNLINTNMLDRPPEMHIIRGPDITFNESNQLGSITTTHGNAKDQIDIRTLDISKDSRVIIQAHGTHSDAKHQLQLYSSLGYESGVDYTSYNFQALRTATKGAPVNVELISCYGGYAIYDTGHLPKNSTLMTFVDGKYTMWSEIGNELILKSGNFIQPENQFTRFASFLTTNADDTRFAINTNDSNKYFFSDIDSLKDFSEIGIKNWQKEQIKQFAKFLNDVKDNTNESNTEKIKQFQDLTKDEEQLTKFVDSFDCKRYREILLANFINSQKISSIKAYLESSDGIDINSRIIGEFTSLYIAAQNGRSEVVELLLAKGANVNQATNNGMSPLYVAALQGKSEVVELLLASGANVNQADNDGMSPLYIAAQNGRSEVVELLLAKGANINQAAHNGFTPLHVAAQNGKSEVTKLLLDNKANVNQAANNGISPLYIAAQNGRSEVVELLVSNGANVNQADNHGESPLYIASHQGKIEVMRLLLNNGANVNQANNNGESPLYVSAHQEESEVMRLLLKNGANVNQATNDGITPLCIATYQGKREVVILLLNNGVSINSENKNLSALQIAVDKGHKEIQEILKSHIASIQSVATTWKRAIIGTLKSTSIVPDVHLGIADLPKDTQIELVTQLKLDIEKLAKQGKGFSIKKIISVFPEEDRAKYFAESAKKAIIECAAQGKDKKIGLILEAFPNQKDRDKILNDALLTPFTPRSKPLLIKRKTVGLIEAVNAISSPLSTPKKLISTEIRAK